MPIITDDHPRVGCLAVPISAVAGLVLFLLAFAALGAGSTLATAGGVLGALVGAGTAALILRKNDDPSA